LSLQNPALKDFWRTKCRNRVLYGGRNSTKSWDAATEAIKLTNKYKLKFLCTRQFQNRISDSVYNLLVATIERLNMRSRFLVLKNSIINKYTGSEFVFYGLWGNVDEVQSLEGIDRCWIEEAHSLKQEQWEILDPTIRKNGSEIWIVFNPKLITDFAYQNFIVNPPDDTLIRKINYDENIFISDTSLKIIEETKRKDPEKYAHIYLGEPLTDDDAAIIKLSWVEAAIDAHIKLNMDFSGAKCVGYDVADGGKDKNATSEFDGSLCTGIDEWSAKHDELGKSAARAHKTALKNNATIIYDTIGVGAGTGSLLNDMLYSNHLKFNAGGKVNKPTKKYEGVRNKDFFSNIKAQMWRRVSDRFLNTFNFVTKGEECRVEDMISISSDCQHIDRLKYELSSVLKDYDKMGKEKVESKDDLLKRGIVSPNLADSFIMGSILGEMKSSVVKQVKVRGF